MSFLKAPGYQDGHAGYSDPLDEQQFVVNEINALEQTPDWSSTAVIVVLRRLRRLVRPRVQRRAQPVEHLGGATPPGPQDFLTGTGHVRQPTAHRRWPASTAAAATGPACRCWSSRRGPRPTTSTTR